ncbi:MAG: Asp-tRNA(Asn)/Glu-tRNA(Gln) amidotransferase subunit GatB, partial [Candidatus Marithrix sp.]|nr:Asp-tRNA(Asn)/Glu-tRNA(Gln) amidotransferase subunit GatB [Candidatus Marithrix sp.]
SPKEAIAYMKKIHSLVRYLEICDGNMQEGSFRCDANISMRPKGQQELGTRTELKNLNSFRFVERALNLEIERQIDVLEGGGKVIQETRLYDSDKNETRSMRSKEEANDYRYFHDPDLLPLIIEPEFLEQLTTTLPELPDVKTQRFINQYNLSSYDANALTNSREMADYFEQVIEKSGCEAKLCANWIIGDLSAFLNKGNLDITESLVNTKQLADMLQRISDNTISGKIAKQVFSALWDGEGDVDTIIDQRGLKQVTDTGAIEKIIAEVINNNPKQLEEYKSGKEKVFGFFVGQVMKASKGKANPKQVNELLKQKLV